MPQYRQGHVFLDPQSLPPSAVTVVTKPAHVVLATGETGREHVFKSGRVALFQANGFLFIEIAGDEPVTLEHPEHGDIEVDPGTYKIIEQREADDIGFGRQERSSYD